MESIEVGDALPENTQNSNRLARNDELEKLRQPILSYHGTPCLYRRQLCVRDMALALASSRKDEAKSRSLDLQNTHPVFRVS